MSLGVGDSRGDPDGVLAVDKPVGPTSHDVVGAARRALKTRRIGHTGTLDPFASGLLLLCVGRATRLAEYLTGMQKTYEAEALLGVETDTEDRTGTVVSESDAWRTLTEADIRSAFAAMQGEIEQTPPAYSAKKVDGERLYAKARRGETVEAAPVRVTILEIEVTRVDLPHVGFRVTASSGTYVRSIARDVGRALGVGAHLTALRRTRIGPHDIERAVPLEQMANAVASEAWLSPLEATAGLPRADVDAEAEAAIRHGRQVTAPADLADAPAVAVSREGVLLAIASSRRGVLQPRKVLI